MLFSCSIGNCNILRIAPAHGQIENLNTFFGIPLINWRLKIWTMIWFTKASLSQKNCFHFQIFKKIIITWLFVWNEQPSRKQGVPFTTIYKTIIVRFFEIWPHTSPSQPSCHVLTKPCAWNRWRTRRLATLLHIELTAVTTPQVLGVRRKNAHKKAKAARATQKNPNPFVARLSCVFQAVLITALSNANPLYWNKLDVRFSRSCFVF